MTITLSEREYDVIRCLINIRIIDEDRHIADLVKEGDKNGYTDDIRAKLDIDEHHTVELNALDDRLIEAYRMESAGKHN